jgi:L-alanine-DL-glutamate epimerase-like enolase superfamily enzyme
MGDNPAVVQRVMAMANELHSCARARPTFPSPSQALSASWNFGIQEENHFRPEELDAFPGHAVLEGGYLYPNDKPGLGVDVDEEKAARLLEPERASRVFYMAEDRKADGTVVRP